VNSVVELGQRLAAVSVDDSWGERDANAWWNEHMADINTSDGETPSGPSTRSVDSPTEATREIVQEND
jgi:hypothetical protein